LATAAAGPRRKLIDNNERSACTRSDRSAAVGVKPRLAEADGADTE
jgi:hypothetical protein